jgi:hypothetical protein
MEKVYQCFIKLLILVLILQLNTSCGEQAADGGSASPSIGTSPVNSTPVNSVEATGFWINAQSTQHTILVNSGSGFGTDCFIDVDSTTNQLMNCYIDVLEGDLYMYDIKIQYNAPPKLCDHVTVTPAWHWNYSSGYGPTAISLVVDTAADPPTFTSCDATDAQSVTTACTANSELTNGTSISGPKCAYDKTSSGGKNCCFGEYTLTKIDAGVTTVTEETWGKEVSDCIGGSVKTSWEKFFKNGYPRSLVQAVEKDASNESKGLNEELTLKANGLSVATSFSFMANHYETLGSPHSHDGYVSATTSNLPYSVEPIDDIDGSLIPSGSEAYVFSCLDSAFEVKHRIKAYIREWNTVADFVAFQTSLGVTYNPDVTGVEGTNCAYDGIFSELCNDFSDFADILTSAGGSYVTTPGAGAAATRATYFPRVDYGGQ